VKNKKRILIIGGIAAGTSAAAKCRRKNEEVEIVIYEKDKYISYGTCGLPYYVSGKIKNINKLLVNTSEKFSKRFNIDVRISHEVIKIIPEDKKILVRDLKSGKEFDDDYDELIVTTGSVPIKIRMEGYESENVFVLKTIKDSLRLKKYINEYSGQGQVQRKAVIIGGGFIGLELIEAFLGNDFDISIIEKTDQLLPIFDREIIDYLENYLKDSGVNIFKEEEAARLITGKDGRVNAVETAGGRILDADLVFFGIGTRPETSLAADCGIEIGKSGAIAVDDNMKTSIDGIFAAGDCCECKNMISGIERSFNLASIANRQGRTAGYNAAGGNERFKGSIVASIIKVLDLAIGKTGLGLKEAERLGYKAGCIELHYGSHAEYYPGSEMMHCLVIYEKDSGKLLGFQAIGKDGIDKRVDVISIALRAEMGLEDLGDLDLSYQPAYGSARDAVNILGLIGENIKKDEVVFIDIPEVREKIAAGDDMVILDVRTEKEFSAGHIDGAMLIYIDDLRKSLDRLDRQGQIIIYCKTGYRAYLGLRILKNLGFSNIRLLNGSYLSWTRKV